MKKLNDCFRSVSFWDGGERIQLELFFFHNKKEHDFVRWWGYDGSLEGEYSYKTRSQHGVKVDFLYDNKGWI